MLTTFSKVIIPLLTLSATAIGLTSAKSNDSLKSVEIEDKLSDEKLFDLKIKQKTPTTIIFNHSL